MTKETAIGFPPPLLGELPLRLPILAETEAWLALDKPEGIGIREHLWDVGVPNLDTALNSQLRQGKPELLRTKASTFGSVYYLEPEASGIALFGKNRKAIADLRNVYGSGHLECGFLFVARHRGEKVGVELSADAPLLPHHTKLKMVPSTAKGKKASTAFHLISISASGWALWKAIVGFIRPHQARAHAAVLGRPVLGDALYEGPMAPTLADLQPKKRGPGMSASIFEGVALHLNEVVIPACDLAAGVRIRAPLSRRFAVLLQYLGLMAQDV